MTMECLVDESKRNAYIFGIPSIMIWIIMLPLFIFIKLFKNRHNLFKNKSLIDNYGFFYIGLKENTFYLEFISHILKFSLACLNVFFASF
jgi:hypothetical protein